MAYLNANIPPIYCKIRREYLYDLKEHKGEAVDCVIFGLASISGRAILFHCMLPNGAVFYRLPISAFFQKEFERHQLTVESGVVTASRGSSRSQCPLPGGSLS